MEKKVEIKNLKIYSIQIISSEQRTDEVEARSEEISQTIVLREKDEKSEVI